MKSYAYYESFILKGRKKNDVTSITQNKKVFRELIDDLTTPFKTVDVVVAPEATGWILGSAIAYKLGAAFVPIRKTGMLSSLHGNIRKTSFVDYSGKKKGFEINKGLIKKTSRVLLVDDWIETGGQANAAAKLIEAEGGKIVGITTIFMHDNVATKNLKEKYKTHSIGSQ